MMKKILYLLSVTLCGGIIFASQPLFQGQYTIDGVDGDTNTGWRLTGTFEDASLLGYGASDATTNDRVYIYSSFGDLDLYKITNIVSVAGSSLSVDVIYDETGTPRAGAPVPGIQIMCRPGYDGYASFLPSLTFGQFTEYLQNGARNLNLKYAIMYAATNQSLIATFNEGATNYVSVFNKTNLHVSFKTNYLTSETYQGTLTGATIAAGSSDGVVVTGPNAAFTWNTNSAGGGGVGTITNILSSDSSIAWTESGGPQPDGSVTGYVSPKIVSLSNHVESIKTDLTNRITIVSNRVEDVFVDLTNRITVGSNAFVAADAVLRSELTNTITVGSNYFYSVRTDLTNRIELTSNRTEAVFTDLANRNTLTSNRVEAVFTDLTNRNTIVSNIVNGLVDQTNLYYPASNPSGFVTAAESEPLWTADSNNVWVAIGNLNGATNALEERVAGLEGATGDYYLATNPDGFVAGLIKVGNTATTQGKIYQQLSDGTWQACYNTNVAYCNKAIGIAYGTNSSSAGMVVIGAVTVTNEDLQIGSNIYVSATAGEWTQTIPSTDGNIIRAIGYAKNTNEIYVTPSPVWVEVGSLINEDTDANTFAITNIGALGAASLQITGGSPTNGATWTSTNILGQGVWDSKEVFYAIHTVTQGFFGDAVIVVQYTNVWIDTAGGYNSGTYQYTIPKSGLWEMSANLLTDLAGDYQFLYLNLVSGVTTSWIGIGIGAENSAIGQTKNSTGVVTKPCNAGDKIFVSARRAGVNLAGTSSSGSSFSIKYLRPLP